jgi:uncharacterized protein YgfB (UPF0149 family)
LATITHEQLSARLQELQLPMVAEALHGSITGLACAGIRPERENWLEQLAQCLDDAALDDAALGEHREAMAALQALVTRDLADGELGFQLLLPDSEEFLSLRAQALGRWSESFICGFISGARDLSTEEREILADIAAISQIDDEEPTGQAGLDRSELNNPENAESNERDFMELCEYVRMAAMDLYNENKPEGISDGVRV